MSSRFKGTSKLAVLAGGLPARERVGLALLASEFALDHLKTFRNYSIGRNAFELARRWYDGERVDPDAFEDAIHDENGEGVDIAAQEAQSEYERTAWLVLQTALMYTGYQAFRAAGEMPTPLISEVEEGQELDYLDEQVHVLSPAFFGVLVQAAKCLKQSPPMSFAQLKSKISAIRI